MAETLTIEVYDRRYPFRKLLLNANAFDPDRYGRWEDSPFHPANKPPATPVAAAPEIPEFQAQPRAKVKAKA